MRNQVGFKLFQLFRDIALSCLCEFQGGVIKLIFYDNYVSVIGSGIPFYFSFVKFLGVGYNLFKRRAFITEKSKAALRAACSIGFSCLQTFKRFHAVNGALNNQGALFNQGKTGNVFRMQIGMNKSDG